MRTRFERPVYGITAGILAGVASLASTGVALAQLGGAFDDPAPDVPSEGEIASEAEGARRRRAIGLRAQVGRSDTILTPLGTPGGPQTARPTLLGGTPAAL